jgi:hypothetical protein
VNFNAARTVFFISMATVMGPTPPGTGVIQLALFLACSKSTSPTNLHPIDFFVSEMNYLLFPVNDYMTNQNNTFIPGKELIPQSITIAPGFIQSPFTMLGCPIPTTSISASAIYITFHKINDVTQC